MRREKFEWDIIILKRFERKGDNKEFVITTKVRMCMQTGDHVCVYACINEGYCHLRVYVRMLVHILDVSVMCNS